MPVDKYPVQAEQKTVGELSVWNEKLYTVLDVACSMQAGLWCAWAVGEQGAVRIGIPEPEGSRLCIRRRFSRRLMEPAGKILRGELRPLGEERMQWEALCTETDCGRALEQRFRQLHGVLTCRMDDRRLVAIPRNDAAPFPLEDMFCFARLGQIGGRDCWIFAFDSRDWPQMP